MKVELHKQVYAVSFEALEWLCVAERLEEEISSDWPPQRYAEADAIAVWARAVYDSCWSDRQKFTLPLPQDWTWWLLCMLVEADRGGEFPGSLLPSLVKQIRSQNRSKLLRSY